MTSAITNPRIWEELVFLGIESLPSNGGLLRSEGFLDFRHSRIGPQ